LKRFLYGSLGVLALALAFHLGAESVKSGYVDNSTTGAVAIAPGANPYILDENGVVWLIDVPSGWRDDIASPPLPVPASEVKLWTTNMFVTHDNHAWRWSEGDWLDMGPWPGSPTATENTSWGRIKADFRE